MDEKNHGFEPELLIQFRRIALSLFVWFLWLVLNGFLGIVLDLAFWDNNRIPAWAHICFYAWYAGGFAGMVWITMKIWHWHRPHHPRRGHS